MKLLSHDEVHALVMKRLRQLLKKHGTVNAVSLRIPVSYNTIAHIWHGTHCGWYRDETLTGLGLGNVVGKRMPPKPPSYRRQVRAAPRVTPTGTCLMCHRQMPGAPSWRRWCDRQACQEKVRAHA